MSDGDSRAFVSFVAISVNAMVENIIKLRGHLAESVALSGAYLPDITVDLDGNIDKA